MRMCFVVDVDLHRPFGLTMRALTNLRALAELGPVDVISILDGDGVDTVRASPWSTGTHRTYFTGGSTTLPVQRARSGVLRIPAYLWSVIRRSPNPRVPWPSDRPMPHDVVYDVVWATGDANAVALSIPARRRVWDMVDLTLHGDVDADGPGTEIRDIRRLGARRVLGNRARRRKQLRDYYRAHADAVDLTVVSQATEARASGITRIAVVPNGYPAAPTIAHEPRVAVDPRVLFVGDFHYPPNREGMRWFLDRVWPLVAAAIPRSELQLVGAGGSAHFTPPASGVQVMDRVEDLAPVLQGAAVSIAPILGGTGSRMKILEAWAHGCPVVATSPGADGLHFSDRENLLVADSPEDFAQAIVEVFHDPELRRSLASGGRATFDSHHSPERIAQTVRRELEALLAEEPGPAWRGPVDVPPAAKRARP